MSEYEISVVVPIVITASVEASSLEEACRLARAAEWTPRSFFIEAGGTFADQLLDAPIHEVVEGKRTVPIEEAEEAWKSATPEEAGYDPHAKFRTD